MVTETALTPAEVISAWRTYRPKSAGPRKVYTVRQWNALQNPYVPPTCLSETTSSLRARAHKRAAGVEWQGGHVFTMPGVASLSDKYPSYTVDITPGARPTCSCHRHQGGDLRAYRVCSHIVAAWIEAEDKGIEYREKPPETSPVVVPNDLEAWKVSGAVASAGVADPEISPEAQALVAALQETDEPTSDIEPYTPQEWADLRPPVLGAATPPWLSSITLPPWATTLRPWQVDAVDQIMAQHRAGKKFVLLEAPTGAGKTLIGEVVRQLIGLEVGDKPGARGCYICTTKSLQDQFLHDFPEARVIKGKSNYPTANFPHAFNPSGQDANGRYDWILAKQHVSCGECTWNKSKGCDWCSRGQDGDQTFRAKLRCPYQMAREASRWAELAVLNTAYFIGMANSGFPRDDEAGGGFAGRPVAILDEFDLVEGVLMSQVEIVMGKRLMERLRIPFPEYKDAKSLGGRAAQECWAPWIEEVAIPAILLEVDRIAEAVKSGGMARKEALKKIRPLGLLRDGLKAARADMLDEDGAAWVYDGYKEGKVIFKPVKVSRFGEAMLWAHAHFFLCMSATLLDAKAYARDIGIPLEEMAVVKIPSSFPPQQRPIILLNTADNRKANQEKAWPKIAAKVVELLERHAEDRVLVHTVSYPFTSYLMDAVRDAGVTDWRKVLSYDSASEREKRLEIYKATPASVMLAPSFDRGIDLPGDLCRVQIIAKVPYPSLGDKQVSARLYSSGGQTWFTMETIRTLCQMAGRGMRKPDDWCWTYVLDEQITKLLGQHRHLFPREFLDAVMQAGYKGMTPKEVERREIQRFR